MRLVAAFASADPGPAVLVGMDTPQVSAEQVSVFDPSRYDACMGPATDGGYWAIGFADPGQASAAITGIPMSTEHTGADQLKRLQELGMRVQILEELTDVDTIDSARDVAQIAPASAFATALATAECR